jgi:UDP-N-acetylmuramyl pentapeptide synthase
LPAGDPLIEAEAAHLSEDQKLRFEGSRREPTPFPPSVRAPDVVILETIPAGLPAGLAGQVVRYAVREVPLVARLPLGGVHNARNGAAALAVVAALGLPLPEAARALARTVLPSHRSFPTAVAGRVILDDCYNANPASMRAALASVVAATGGAGRPFAILGDMLELGPDTVAQHREVGREAGRQLAGLVAVGALGAELVAGAREGGLAADCAVAVGTPAEAATLVARWSRPGDWILVKASRGMRLERAIDALGEEFRKQPAMT